MTTFVDGPARGQILELQRAARFLRVVVSRARGWDALDQPDDAPRADERIHVYEITERPTRYHVLRRGKGQRSGWYMMASYRFVTSAADVRDTASWQTWCEARAQQNPRTDLSA